MSLPTRASLNMPGLGLDANGKWADVDDDQFESAPAPNEQSRLEAPAIPSLQTAPKLALAATTTSEITVPSPDPKPGLVVPSQQTKPSLAETAPKAGPKKNKKTRKKKRKKRKLGRSMLDVRSQAEAKLGPKPKNTAPPTLALPKPKLELLKPKVDLPKPKVAPAAVLLPKPQASKSGCERGDLPGGTTPGGDLAGAETAITIGTVRELEEAVVKAKKKHDTLVVTLEAVQAESDANYGCFGHRQKVRDVETELTKAEQALISAEHTLKAATARVDTLSLRPTDGVPMRPVASCPQHLAAWANTKPTPRPTIGQS